MVSIVLVVLIDTVTIRAREERIVSLLPWRLLQIDDGPLTAADGPLCLVGQNLRIK
jgi:hypothetical protein